ncbi:hypothetical protein ACFLSY_12350, partial [Bacteroidota bacterium]
MKIHYKLVFVILLLISNLFSLKGEETQNTEINKTKFKSLAAPCARGNTITYISYNNVNTPIHLTGTLWTDPDGQSGYEIPKGSGLTSLYAGGIWIAGTDVNEQLK